MDGVKLPLPRGRKQQCLEILAVGTYLYLFIFSGLISLFLSIYILIYTKYWWLIGIYLCWAWIIDKDTPEQGGRICRWTKSWSLWKYKRDYFPLRYERLPGFELDPEKNYLFCCFPHGLIADGFVNAFGFEDHKYFPQHTTHGVTLSLTFKMPFTRELFLSLGAVSASAKSIEYLLSRPGGGHICALVAGGAKESYYCRPGSYRIVVKQRKGFVKLALRNGSPMVPVISFGETDLYDQVTGPWITSIQEFVRKWVGIVPIIPMGRFFIFPHKRMVTTLVGRPLEVPKIPDPTQKDIDEYHAKFVEKLTEMFEEQKHKYLEKPEDKQMIIE